MAFKLPSQASSSFFVVKKREIILGIIAVTIIAALVGLYYSPWRTNLFIDEEESNLIKSNKSDTTEIADEIKFDTSFFKSPIFKNLKIYGDWSLEPDRTGRSQPFLPN